MRSCCRLDVLQVRLPAHTPSYRLALVCAGVAESQAFASCCQDIANCGAVCVHIAASLFGAGWKLLRKRPKDDLPLLNVTVGPVLPANRWIRLSPDASHVGRPYLQCLAKVDQSSSFRSYLRDNGVCYIQHGQSDKYYEALVSENPGRLLKVDFEADVSVPEARSLRDARATAAAGQSKSGTFKLQESFRGGADSFKYHQPPKGSEHGSLQCDCVRKSHRRKNAKGQGIPCTRTCKFTTEDERVALVRRMKHWVVLGFDCHSHRIPIKPCENPSQRFRLKSCQLTSL